MNDQLSSEEFTKRFNEGYLISKEMPELSGQLVKAVSNTEQGEAFKAGHEEYINERNRSLYPSWLRNGNETRKDINEDLRTDYDEMEKE